PSLIEAVTDRLTAHSSDDNDKLYRTEEEINEMKENDCVHTIAAYLTDLGILTKEKSEAMDKEMKQEINEATKYAEAAPLTDPATLMDYVYEPKGVEYNCRNNKYSSNYTSKARGIEEG